jgi:hypothetical protein
MIKTLRITSILAAVLAIALVGFFVFRIAHGAQGDNPVREFLNSPTVIEKFKTAEGNRAKTRSSQISPLVQQAQAIALYLNPPASRGTQNIRSGPNAGGAGSQPNVTPKFKVLGISFYEQNPALSMALIDEPGKGKHWVKQSTQVGHLFVKEVQNDLVIVQGGSETFKIAAEREAPKPKSPVSSSTSVYKKPAGTVSTASRARPPMPSRPRPTIRQAPDKSAQVQPDEDKNEKLEELYQRLRDLKGTSDNTESDLSEEERAEQIEKLISNFKASYISPEEAKKLEDLGEQLENAEIEPNLADSNDEL